MPVSLQVSIFASQYLCKPVSLQASIIASQYLCKPVSLQGSIFARQYLCKSVSLQVSIKLSFYFEHYVLFTDVKYKLSVHKVLLTCMINLHLRRTLINIFWNSLYTYVHVVKCSECKSAYYILIQETHQSESKHVLGAQKNHLTEMVLLSAHNIHFSREIRQFIWNSSL